MDINLFYVSSYSHKSKKYHMFKVILIIEDFCLFKS